MFNSLTKWTRTSKRIHAVQYTNVVITSYIANNKVFGLQLFKVFPDEIKYCARKTSLKVHSICFTVLRPRISERKCFVAPFKSPLFYKIYYLCWYYWGFYSQYLLYSYSHSYIIYINLNTSLCIMWKYCIMYHNTIE